MEYYSNTQMNHSTVKQITFPNQLVALAASKAAQFGITLPEYVRYLVIKDTLPTIKLSKEDEENILEGVEDIKAGRYVTVRTKKELKDFLHSLKIPHDKNIPH